MKEYQKIKKQYKNKNNQTNMFFDNAKKPFLISLLIIIVLTISSFSVINFMKVKYIVYKPKLVMVYFDRSSPDEMNNFMNRHKKVIYEFYYRLQNVNDDKEEIIKLYSYNIPIKYNMGSGRSFYEVIKIFDQYGYLVYTSYIDSIEDINFERIEEIFLENGWN